MDGLTSTAAISIGLERVARLAADLDLRQLQSGRDLRSGTAHADMDAHQFLARLCALVPPPGFHMTC